jgi:hypothetical protein
VAFFFKQWGGRTPKAGGRRLDGLSWNQMPDTPLAVHLALTSLTGFAMTMHFSLYAHQPGWLGEATVSLDARLERKPLPGCV